MANSKSNKKLSKNTNSNRIKRTKKALKRIGLITSNATPTSNFITTVGATSDSVVPVTYALTKSNDVEVKRLFIGDTKIELEVDQDPTDPNKFATRGTKKYMCIRDEQGLKIVVRADGKTGGGWSLEVIEAGSTLNDNPISEETDNNGHLDHNDFHS